MHTRVQCQQSKRMQTAVSPCDANKALAIRLCRNVLQVHRRRRFTGRVGALDHRGAGYMRTDNEGALQTNADEPRVQDSEISLSSRPGERTTRKRSGHR
jgi:hypothetical protein